MCVLWAVLLAASPWLILAVLFLHGAFVLWLVALTLDKRRPGSSDEVIIRALPLRIEIRPRGPANPDELNTVAAVVPRRRWLWSRRKSERDTA